MKKQLSILAIGLIALSACNKAGDSQQYSLEEEQYVANFMLNYRRETFDAPSGNTGIADNLLYEQKEIKLGEAFTAPSVDPVRIKYSFEGWFKEAECINEYNFSTLATGNIFLFAKWGTDSSDGFVEPEYSYPEHIINNDDFVIDDVLNMPVSTDSKVLLSTGAINRLKNSPNDVKFAIHYGHKENVSLKSAQYDESTGNITLTTSNNITKTIKVVDNTINLSIASESPTYENKAQKYETNGSSYENYHIVLAGSSSMEFWTNSKEDLLPMISYNHGIGGTTVTQWTDKLLERLVLPYSPKAVVYYVGVNNIINSGNTGEQTGTMLNALFDKTHEHLPNTKVFYVLINKLPGYARCQNDFDKANEMALNYASNKEWITCIDAGVNLLKETGQPNSAYFRTDGLHMSQYGYVLWGNEIRKALIDWLS